MALTLVGYEGCSMQIDNVNISFHKLKEGEFRMSIDAPAHILRNLKMESDDDEVIFIESDKVLDNG